MMLHLLIALMAGQAAPGRVEGEPKAPEGFVVEKVADSTFPMFATFDDRGRLYVTESSGGDLYLELQNQTPGCRIRRFEDKDGDGVFETSTVFAEGLRPSMGLVWRAGKLYVADPPDLAVLEDLDDDGRADRRHVILSGFGHRDNGSLHGLLFGPDGLLYMTTGEPDGYALKGRDGKILSGVSGALLRCKPDGSDPEVVARGFENLVEIAFLPGGDIIGTCNWYQKPAGGIRDALVHLVDGGLYPYVPDKGTALPLTGTLIPPLALFPAVALSGLARLESASFPEAMRGNLFSAQHNSRKVQRHVLTRSGSSYAAESFDFVTCESPDFHPSDVLEAPDGSLIVVDTGAWYVQHCPTGKIRNSRAPGGIYRVRYTGPKAGGKRAEPARIPVGLSPELLQKWLPDPSASRALARMAKPEAAPALVAVLQSGDASQRFAAAEALATCGTPESVPAIWAALAGEPDRFLEHSLIHAAGRIADGKALEAALKHEHPRVQKAALQLLDQKTELPANFVLERAGASDPELRLAALRILQRHPAWVTSAAVLVESWLSRELREDEERTRLNSLILAFQSDGRIQELVGAALQKGSGARRAFLLETISEASLTKLPGPWKDGISASLAHDDPAVRGAALRTVAVLRLQDQDEKLAEIADRAVEPPAIRLEALRAIVARRPRLSAASLEFLRTQVTAGGEALPRLAAAEVLRAATLADADLALVLKSIRGDGLISPSLFLPALSRAGGPALDEAAASIRGGWRPSMTELGPLIEKFPADARDLVEKGGQELGAKLARFEALLKGGDPAKGREIFFGKKVACGTCHAVGTQGGKVGPDLTKVGAIRAGRDLLESILLPSSTFAQGYEPYLVLTQDGNVLSGLIARQSADAVVLRDAGGAEVQLRRDRIKEMRRAEKSIMPEGLERAISEQEFRDLMAFLQGLK
jgi:putative heme-binding domain-containing protein